MLAPSYPNVPATTFLGRAASAGVARAAHRLPQKVGGAPSRIGSTITQSGHQRVPGVRGHGQQWTIAPLAGVVVATGALLGKPIGLADGGVQINGQRIIARSRPSRPGAGQHLPAHPVQLADVAPPETAQKSPQGGRRLDRAAQHTIGTAGAQRVGVVDAIATGQRRRHQGQHLVASVGPTRRFPKVNVAIHRLAQTKMMGQSERQDQSGVGHQAVIVEGDIDAVGVVAW